MFVFYDELVLSLNGLLEFVFVFAVHDCFDNPNDMLLGQLPTNSPVPCQGPWTVLLQRENNTVSFDQRWYRYVTGFGHASKDFWIGLNSMLTLTNQRSYILRIDTWDSYGEFR